MSKMSARDIELVVVYYIGLAEFGYSGELIRLLRSESILPSRL